MKNTYTAVVETGWHSACGKYYETSIECGHKHRTIGAAEACGEKHYDAGYRNGSWTANAAWHGYTVHDQNGLNPYREEWRELAAQYDAINQAYIESKLDKGN